MKLDLELLTFIGVLFTLIVSIFSIWDRIKPKYPLFSVHLQDRKILVIKNLGQKKGKIFKIEIDNYPIEKFSHDKRRFPIEIEPNEKIEYKIIVNDSIPTFETCSIVIKGFINIKVKTFSV